MTVKEYTIFFLKMTEKNHGFPRLFRPLHHSSLEYSLSPCYNYPDPADAITAWSYFLSLGAAVQFPPPFSIHLYSRQHRLRDFLMQSYNDIISKKK